MIKKNELLLLKEIYDNKGRIMFKQQQTFGNQITFYRAIGTLKRKEFIIVTNISHKNDNRITTYEITGKGIELVKLLSDENEY